MKALQLIAHGCPGTFAWHHVPTPSPGPEDVLVQIEACGLNHLDLWMESNNLPIQPQLPRTPGCEPSGTIRAVGSTVQQWKPGDRVSIQSNFSCGTCPACVRGEDSMCLHARILGVELDGGFSEYMVVPARQLVALPSGLSTVHAAALSLAASTAMHMLTDRIQVAPGQSVLVMAGASGVGSAAIQIARELGCRVCSTGSTPEKRQLAQSLGAELTLDPADPLWPRQVRQWTSKRGVDVIIEHIGGKVIQQALDCLARGGSLVTCGATAGREIQLNLWSLFVKQQRLIGSYSRNRRDLIQTLQWAGEGRLKPVIDRVMEMSEGPAAYQRLRNRSALGKIVLTPP